MNSRIRYGNEQDISAAIRGYNPPEEPELGGRTVLSFSQKLRGLPDIPQFEDRLEALGISYQDLGPAKSSEYDNNGDRWILHANRKVQITNRGALPRETVMYMGRSLLQLAHKNIDFGHNDVVFVDHTLEPEGVHVNYDNFDKLLYWAAYWRISHLLRTSIVDKFDVFGDDETDPSTT